MPCHCGPSLVFQLPWQPDRQPNVILINEVKSAGVCLSCLQLRMLANSEASGENEKIQEAGAGLFPPLGSLGQVVMSPFQTHHREQATCRGFNISAHVFSEAQKKANQSRELYHAECGSVKRASNRCP